jgi:stage II sporulation protein M
MLQSQFHNQRLFMKEYAPLYIFVSVLFVMGVVFGALMVNALAPEQKQEMFRYLTSFFHAINQDAAIDRSTSLEQTFALHLKWIGLIWVLGLSIVGLPLILVLNFLKGVLVGFSIGFMSSQLAWKGMLFSLVSIVPSNMVVVPVLMMASVGGIAFSLHLIKNRASHSRNSITSEFVRYTASALLLVGVLLAVSFFEAYASPHIMKWVTPMLVA